MSPCPLQFDGNVRVSAKNDGHMFPSGSKLNALPDRCCIVETQTVSQHIINVVLFKQDFEFDQQMGLDSTGGDRLTYSKISTR